jgi:hypothetical protein
VGAGLGNLPEGGNGPFVANNGVGGRPGDPRVQQDTRNQDEEHNDNGHRRLS